jgi:Tfp pilus assembly protein PilF
VKSFLLLLWTGVTSLAIALAACAPAATTRSNDVAPLFHDALFKRPAAPIDSAAIFALDAPMRRFLAQKIAPQMIDKDPRRALLDALADELRLDYDAEETRTASQAFAAREGNCLSLVIMAAAFARQLGIRVTFQEVYGFDTWQRHAGLSFLSQHVNLVFGQPQSRLWVESDARTTPMIVDFVPPRKVASAVTKPISEQTIVAMYMNNRAAEVLATGEASRAYWYARAALEADPTFTAAANTLGVIYWNLGQKALSEQALRFTLEREPGNVPALTNLVQMLNAEGRTTEAQSVAKELAEAQRYPPFYFYDLGMQALNAQDFEDAVRQFKKDLAQRPYDSQSHFGLAMAAMHLGDMPQARKELQVAIKNATTVDQRALYAAKLRQLKPS